MEKTETSAFDHVERIEWDPIIQIFERYRLCNDPNKINLTVGAYRDENIKPVVFNSVRKAEERVLSQKCSHFYLKPTGDDEFNKLTQYTIFPPDHRIHAEKRILTAQSCSGTGCLRLGGEFLSKFITKIIYVPHLTWPNHFPIFQFSGMEVRTYRYYDEKTRLLDLEGMLEDLENAEEGSVVVLHVCGHNPTGVDPSEDDWKKIVYGMKKRNLFPFFDDAYQGYVSGDIYKDAYPIYLFFENGFEMFIAQSFSKSMGLYGERAGPLHIIVNDSNSLTNIKSQLNELALSLYITPLGHGSRIIKTLLGDEELKTDWLNQLKSVANRLIDVREKLYKSLQELNVPGTWDHIKSQKGMFSYTGLNEKQCEILIEKHKIFLVKTGRISLSGLNYSNIEKVALAIKDVLESNYD